MFPQALIDQWLSKPRESRRSVQEDPKATPAILENIHQLEVYCVEHPYAVFCSSLLHRPPFALYALESAEEEAARLARPPIPFAAMAPHTEMISAAVAESHASGGLGGRYAGKAERHGASAAATDHLRSVTARLSAYLQSTALVHKAQGSSDKATRIAQLVVRVITEAAVAAAVRHGVAAQVEADERAAFQRQLQPRRRLQLHVRDGKESGMAAAQQASATSVTGAGAKAGSREDDDDDDGSNSNAGADDFYVAVRPIADYRRDCQGLLSMVGLLHPQLQCAVTDDGDGDKSKGSGLLTSAPGKLPRSGSAWTAKASRTSAAERDGEPNFWTQLRESGLQRFFGADIPPPPQVAAAEMRASQAAAPLMSDSGWAGTQLPVTERDVLFALKKVFASDAL